MVILFTGIPNIDVIDPVGMIHFGRITLRQFISKTRITIIDNQKMKINKELLMAIGVFAAFSCNQQKEPYADCTNFDELDRQISYIIDQVEGEYAKDDEFLAAFNMEQVYWIQYRDRRLRAMYPKNWDRHYRKIYGREVFNNCKCLELSRLARTRIKDLKMYLEGIPNDQKGCPNILVD